MTQPLPLAMAHTLKHGFSLNLNKSTSYFLAGLGLEPQDTAEGQEEKAVGKTCQGIPFIACCKIC